MVAKPQHFFDLVPVSPKVPGRGNVLKVLGPCELNISLSIVKSGTTGLLAKFLFRDLPRKDHTNEQMPRVCKEGEGRFEFYCIRPCLEHLESASKYHYRHRRRRRNHHAITEPAVHSLYRLLSKNIDNAQPKLLDDAARYAERRSQETLGGEWFNNQAILWLPPNVRRKAAGVLSTTCGSLWQQSKTIIEGS